MESLRQRIDRAVALIAPPPPETPLERAAVYLWTLMSDARSYVARADSQNATMAFWLASEVLDAVAALKSSERIALRPPERP